MHRRHGLGFNLLSLEVNGVLIGTGGNKGMLYSKITEDRNYHEHGFFAS